MSKYVVSKLRRLFPKVLNRELPKDIKLAEVGSSESRRLNGKFFGKKTAANVLSFRYSPDYGEILICPAVIRREAKEQGHTYKYQMTWMILHGMLHLAGLHHEKSKREASGTERLEQKILQAFKS